MAEIVPISLVFDLLGPWAGPWPKSIPEASFSMFWTPGRDHGQNRPQNLHFQRFGPLGRTMARMDPRNLMLDLLGAWAELWPHNRSQKLDVRRFDYLGGAMAEVDPRALIFDALDPWAEPWPKSIPEA
jgi:hypothetical protein